MAALQARLTAGGDLAEPAGMLLDLARVQDGEPPRDPAEFARRIEKALASSLG
jgi:molecular chaperone HtpG